MQLCSSLADDLFGMQLRETKAHADWLPSFALIAKLLARIGMSLTLSAQLASQNVEQDGRCGMVCGLANANVCIDIDRMRRDSC